MSNLFQELHAAAQYRCYIYERDLLWVFSFFLLLLSLEPAVLGYNPLLLMTIVVITNLFPYLSYDLFFFSQVADTYDLV